ncbi:MULTISPECIES: hypothetical protein [unclassified Archaeoglobus]|uniref:hypothetical protein n=1 Tax=unclassified Archaeoglobus TaxID=2643606 RepID=UPI0025C23E8C|nr:MULTISPECIES: hypothetical protein [unclassified Archaeoglobus]
MKKAGLLAALIVLGIAATATAANDEVSILFNSWLEGKPLGLVKISVETPKTDDVCFVAVHRFPTSYNPTEKWNQSDVVYRGKVKCGETVVVKDLIRMIQVGLRDEKNGEAKPIFDSPEYAIVVISKEGGFSRILQTDVVKPITELNVKAEFETTAGKSRKPDLETKSSACYIRSNPDVCVVDVKLTYVNSIPGLKVAFGLDRSPPSLMYIESWGSSCISTNPDSPCPSSMWHSNGKKKTISQVSDLSDYISNGKKAIIWGDVEYRYERFAVWDDDFEIYWKYELFYPTAIGGLSTPQVIGNYHQPSSPPYYARGPFKGTKEVNFERPYQSNSKLSLTTYIGLNIGSLSFGISVSPYKAGDDRYTTPYIRIVDVSGKGYAWYYWWYRNNDPMTYKIQFYGN